MDEQVRKLLRRAEVSGNSQDRIRALQRYLRGQPDDVEALLQMTRLDPDTGEWSQRAERILQERLEHNPSDIASLRNMQVLHPDEMEWALLLRSALCQTTDNPVVIVDYSMTLDEMIEDEGIGAIDADVTEQNFPISGAGIHVVELVMVEPHRYLPTKEEICSYLDGREMRPARIEEAFALRSQDIGTMRPYHLIIPGSMCVKQVGQTNKEWFPWVLGVELDMTLSPLPDVDFWQGCRFLASPKSQ